MALTRAMLNGMGLTADQVSAIIEAHTDTVDGLKDQIKKNADSAKENADLKKRIEELEKNDGSDWQTKYEKEHSDFEAYKKDIVSKENAEKVKTAYTQLLKDSGVSEKRIESILKITKLDEMKLNKEGSFDNVDALKENIKKEWSDFIVEPSKSGASTTNPPKGAGVTGNTYTTKDEIMKITDRVARRQAIKDNPQLFVKEG